MPCCVGLLVLIGEAESTVAVLVKHSVSVALAKKEGASKQMEQYANLSTSLPNLYSLPQHCGMLRGLLSGSYSAYFNKNTYHFPAIQTCICMHEQNLLV